MTESSFQNLIETYEEQCGAKVVDTRTNTCNCIEFAEDGFPTAHTLGEKALDHGFIVSSVSTDNGFADDGAIPVWFKPFSMRKETKTVEVEKEATVVHVNGSDHVIFD